MELTPEAAWVGYLAVLLIGLVFLCPAPAAI